MDINGQYLTYEDYKFLGGSLAIKPFNLLEFKARMEIDKRTFGRLKHLSNQLLEVKTCEFEIINKLDSQSRIEQKAGVQSENTDRYSVTYASIDLIIESSKKDISNIINTYLAECKLEDGTPYLYRG